jgi:spermidine synthase
MAAGFEILAYEDTDLGALCLRRRRTLSEPREWVTEITLNHEFLMSSLHTDSEQQLATIPLQQLAADSQPQSDGLRVLIGGLGLGYTAHAALASSHVSHVEVVEYLPQVIDWMQAGLTPLGAELAAEPRLQVQHGDIFAHLLAEPQSELWDAVLIDVDHSPDERLSNAHQAFYTIEGLNRVARHLHPGGLFALWSYDRSPELQETMQQVFVTTDIYPVTYHNRHVHEDFTDWLYVGRCREDSTAGDTLK